MSRLYPVERPAAADPRFTFGLAMDVARVLTDHGYPDINDAASGTDLVELQQALFRFIYGEES